MSDHIASANADPKASRPVVGKLEEEDLPEAARIFRLAFGTFLGAPNPDMFWADRDYVYGRQQAAHVASFGATLDGKLVGSNFATNWGSVGFFGPLTVRPDLQEQGIARALLAVTMQQFDIWKTQHVGLFTLTARNISPCIKGTAFTRVSSQQSCRQERCGKRQPDGCASAS
ncbi:MULTISPECIES: GNAT family N-acetyltransferase [unclassified Bradyrhizobium]|uniref:GNAT family N-acetyltransferase n=1 Tax=unclassified Bradyrhizobium TaxID=2631580 RepID=UPI002FF3A4D2